MKNKLGLLVVAVALTLSMAPGAIANDHENFHEQVHHMDNAQAVGRTHNEIGHDEHHNDHINGSSHQVSKINGKADWAARHHDEHRDFHKHLSNKYTSYRNDHRVSSGTAYNGTSQYGAYNRSTGWNRHQAHQAARDAYNSAAMQQSAVYLNNHHH